MPWNGTLITPVTLSFSKLPSQKHSTGLLNVTTPPHTSNKQTTMKLTKEELIEVMASLAGNLTVFLLAGWLMMLVLGWLGVVGITYGKALVIVILIDFLKTSSK